MKHAWVLSLLMLCRVAPGVSPGTWEHTSEADFQAGTSERVAVTSLGEARLARDVRIVLAAEDAPDVVSALAVDGKTIYAGAGDKCAVYRIVGDKAEKLAEPPGTIVGSLRLVGEAGARELLVGTCGDGAGLYRIDEGGAVEKVWAEESVKHVWSVVPGKDGVLYAATGPEGKIFAIDAAGDAKLLYHADGLAKNILCLMLASDGRLFAGTDEKGLVIQIDPAAPGAGRVVFDAPEKEISTLVEAEDGGVHVATSDVAKAKADGKTPPEDETSGKAAPSAGTRPAPDGPQPGPLDEPTPSTRPAGENETENEADAEAALRRAERAPEGGGALVLVARRDGVQASPVSAETRKPPAGTQPARKPGEKGSREELRSIGGAPGGPPNGPPSRPVRRPSGGPAGNGPGAGPADGNAVYHVQSNGLVRTLFRRPVLVLAMRRAMGADGRPRLILGTGNGGAIYAVTLDGDEVAQLADTEAGQITALAESTDGIVFATANKGSVGFLQAALAKEGTLTSQPLDAGQIAQWGMLHLTADTPPGTGVKLQTRSGNLDEPHDSTWSAWSDAVEAGGKRVAVTSPTARFLQYRLVLTGNGRATPTIQSVEIVYQVGNLAPAVAGVKVEASALPRSTNRSPEQAGGAKAYRLVAIQAKDPNGDDVAFTVEFRRVGAGKWIPLAERLREPKYVWDTRGVPDGAYELRVTASDAPSNPPASALTAARISDRLIVDNTAPVLGKVAVREAGDELTVSGEARDATSRIVGIHYAVDSADAWTAVLPADGICDSSVEEFTFTPRSADLKALKPGVHWIAVKAEDLLGNVGHAGVRVTVKEAGGDE